jgi:CubicO group peptidase (beta-lactamase class C family)
MKMKKFFFTVSVLIGIGIVTAGVYLNSLLPIITGYAAKNLCSNVFISGRSATDIESVDLNFSFIRYTNNKVDYNEKSVTSRFLWGHSKAIYREGFGVTLLRDIPEDVLRKAIYCADTNPGYSGDTTLWPLGDLIKEPVETGIDKRSLEAITGRLMNENGYHGNAFAFIVLHKGIPVAEAYKPQFNRHTRFLSWSMAKSFTNGIIGTLVELGKIDIYQPADVDEWKGDERSKITINDLLQMQSGLKWNEDYGSRSDVNLMLFNEGDMSRYAVNCKAEYPSGTHWYYSSGTANILTWLIRKEFESDTSCYSFIHDSFLEKTGITDAVFEVDASGDWVGSSYLYATARDYARFALLYLNDGIFNNERILPEGWVAFTRTPASGSHGKYGALFWLNQSRKYPSAPVDMFSCEGHDGQRIFILPSKDLVVVVLGYSPTPDNQMDFDGLLRDIIDTLNP